MVSVDIPGAEGEDYCVIAVLSGEERLPVRVEVSLAFERIGSSIDVAGQTQRDTRAGRPAVAAMVDMDEPVGGPATAPSRFGACKATPQHTAPAGPLGRRGRGESGGRGVWPASPHRARLKPTKRAICKALRLCARRPRSMPGELGTETTTWSPRRGLVPRRQWRARLRR